MQISLKNSIDEWFILIRYRSIWRVKPIKLLMGIYLIQDFRRFTNICYKDVFPSLQFWSMRKTNL